MFAGDEALSDEEQNPELFEDDPLDYSCETCGAAPGHECQPDCAAGPW